MSVEKNLGTLFLFSNQKFLLRSSHHENLRNQNQQKKNKKEVLP